jgi:hypothetical protein
MNRNTRDKASCLATTSYKRATGENERQRATQFQDTSPGCPDCPSPTSAPCHVSRATIGILGFSHGEFIQSGEVCRWKDLGSFFFQGCGYVMFEGIVGNGWSIIASRFISEAQKSVTVAPNFKGPWSDRDSHWICGRVKTLKLFLVDVSEWWHDRRVRLTRAFAQPELAFTCLNGGGCACGHVTEI